MPVIARARSRAHACDHAAHRADPAALNQAPGRLGVHAARSRLPRSSVHASPGFGAPVMPA